MGGMRFEQNFMRMTITLNTTTQSGTSTMETSGQITMLSAALYMIFGMAIMSMAFNLIQEEMLTKFIWISDKLGGALVLSL